MAHAVCGGDPASGRGVDHLGEVLGGRYELVDLLARGAQGVLYRAHDLKDGDDVAIKVLTNSTRDPDALERMFREAHAMMQLAGTAAVRVLDQVHTEDGEFCLVMELLRGRELKERLVELEAAGERMPVAEILRIFDPIVKTLEAARERGIVHRDIKPGNIFLLVGGGVRLLDFGFARLLRHKPLTRDGVVAGTPSHIPPEVWQRAPDLDHRVDVYALGVVLFRVLAGRPPFAGGLEEVARAVVNDARPSLHALRSDLPPAIDDWVEHALAVDREKRFTRVLAMWNALRVCLRVA
jgi:serine/threonine protein kinase